ncbi:MAG: proline dehydrogenase family protein [Chloroflexi bacterium]|nr:proline dehydrogenase family protein [Chloroflexota bacterium]
MFRATLLYLSRNRTLQRQATGLPLARRLSRRFVAGETLPEALAAAEALNRRGILVTLDHLGENVTNPEEARRATGEYIEILRQIAQRPGLAGTRCTISVKLTQLGLDTSDEFCLENTRAAVSEAARLGNWVEIDMEGSLYTERTLNLYHRLRLEFTNLRVCVQAYLYRTQGDLRPLIEVGASVRLCKGAYDEPPNLAFPKKAEVDANYRRLLALLLSEEARKAGAFAAIATHDERIINWALGTIAEQRIERQHFEFQMLYGIRRDWQEQLAAQGYTVRVYVPYGQEWYPYFMRRLAERPANFLFLLRQIVSA